jgi:hypothetical protein
LLALGGAPELVRMGTAVKQRGHLTLRTPLTSRESATFKTCEQLGQGKLSAMRVPLI